MAAPRRAPPGAVAEPRSDRARERVVLLAPRRGRTGIGGLWLRTGLCGNRDLKRPFSSKGKIRLNLLLIICQKGILQQICPNARVDQRGVVTLGGGQPQGVGCGCLQNLISHPRIVTIRPVQGPIPVRGGLSPAATGFNAGADLQLLPPGFVGPPAAGPGSNSTVRIDTSDNGGVGYSAFGPNGVRIDAPLDVILFHELCTSHATQNANGTRDPQDPERDPIACENVYRAAQLPPRTPRVGNRDALNGPGQGRGQR